MFVCLCRNIKTVDLHKTLSARPECGEIGKNGVSLEFAEEMHLKCSGGLGYNCGSCQDTVKEVIDAYYDTKISADGNNIALFTESKVNS